MAKRQIKGKIGVLIEDHFDQTEFRKFNEFFPAHGYEVEYISHLWGNPQLEFGGNPDNPAETPTPCGPPPPETNSWS